MKNWIKRKLRIFLCEHENTIWVKELKTVIERPSRDYTQEPGATESEIIFFKRWVHCKDCGGRNLIIKYKA